MGPHWRSGLPAVVTLAYLPDIVAQLGLIAGWSDGRPLPITFPLRLLAARQAAAWALDLLRSVVLRNRTDGALERVTIPVYGSAAETTERLVKYVQAMYPRLGEHLLG